MIATVEIPAATRRVIARHAAAAEKAGGAMAGALESAAVMGAETVRELLVTDGLGLEPANMHPAEGLAASVSGWLLDASEPVAAIGVPSNTPAARYAGILERGGTIYPRTARMLAIPLTDEARRYTSPRDMPGLDLIPREGSGKPPLLVRALAGSGEGFTVHWVLVRSVTIAPRHWLSEGVERAAGDIARTFADEIGNYVRTWEGN